MVSSDADRLCRVEMQQELSNAFPLCRHTPLLLNCTLSSCLQIRVRLHQSSTSQHLLVQLPACFRSSVSFHSVKVSCCCDFCTFAYVHKQIQCCLIRMLSKQLLQQLLQPSCWKKRNWLLVQLPRGQEAESQEEASTAATLKEQQISSD